jgi:hypothetical protein
VQRNESAPDAIDRDDQWWLSRCEAEKAAADEQMSFVFSKKKAVVAEKRQKKEQKEEAEKHIRMQKELVRAPAWILSYLKVTKVCSGSACRDPWQTEPW